MDAFPYLLHTTAFSAKPLSSKRNSWRLALLREATILNYNTLFWRKRHTIHESEISTVFLYRLTTQWQISLSLTTSHSDHVISVIPDFLRFPLAEFPLVFAISPILTSVPMRTLDDICSINNFTIWILMIKDCHMERSLDATLGHTHKSVSSCHNFGGESFVSCHWRVSPCQLEGIPIEICSCEVCSAQLHLSWKSSEYQTQISEPSS